MLHRAALALVLITAALPATAAPRPSPAETVKRPTIGSITATLDERTGWGLFVGVAIVGLALRRRRTGPVVSN